jgi:uncharacterized protein (TIGR03435 family)
MLTPIERPPGEPNFGAGVFLVAALLAITTVCITPAPVLAAQTPAANQSQAPAAAQSSTPAAAQSSATPAPPAEKLEFDVASIRAIKPGDLDMQCEPTAANGWCGRIWGGTFNIPFGPDDGFRPTGGLFTATAPAIMLIQFAYKITTSQRAALGASAPKWVLDEPFQIQARTRNLNVTKDQMRAMVRSLLADRFHLAVHTEMRQTPVFAVVLAKPGKLGPQLRPHPAGAPCSSTAQPLEQQVRNNAPPPDQATIAGGFPALCGVFVRLPPSAPGLRHEGGRNMSIATMATAFSGLGVLGHPAIDQTGLTGAFDWVIEFQQYTEGVETEENSGPSFGEALKNQLGLELKRETAPFPFLVIDHVERPTPN